MAGSFSGAPSVGGLKWKEIEDNEFSKSESLKLNLIINFVSGKSGETVIFSRNYISIVIIMRCVPTVYAPLNMQ